MSKPKLFGPKNLLVYLIVAYLFYFLYSYRLNSPLPVSSRIPDTILYTLNGEKFLLNDYRSNKFLIFFDKASVYSPYYLKVIPDLKLIAESFNIDIFLIFKKPVDVELLKKILQKNKYKLLENITYSANISKLADDYGIRSWPHFYMINSDNKVIYQAKLPSVRAINDILRRY